MSIFNFKIRNFKIVYLGGKPLKKIIDRKSVSAPRKYNEVFRKIKIKKMRFQVQKYEKYLNSKNDLKKSLGAFINEL